MFDLVSKTAVVTGASRGIGKAIAIAFAKEKVNVVINFCHDEKSAKEVLKEIESFGVKGIICKADIKNRDEVKSMINKVLEKFGTIDFLINNAGIINDSMLKNMTEDMWNEVIETNLTGVFNVTKAVLPFLKEGSSIINISSVVGQIGNIGQVNYASSKAGLFGFTKSLAKELARKNIRVNAVAPGLIGTDIVKNVPQEILQNFIKMIPLNRMGNAEEIAHAVIFLLQNEYVTGEILNVNGGIYS